MKRWAMLGAFVLAAALLGGCAEENSSDARQQKQQEVLLDEATSQVGMPSIKNFRERKILKDIYELRDQDGLTTYTYVFNELNGKLVFLSESIGYGIPAATQFTAPEKWSHAFSGAEWGPMPQADPNGLFSPSSAEGTWVLLKDPHGDEVRPVYVEPRVIVSPFKLNT